MAEEFDEALEAARAEWASEHDSSDYHGGFDTMPTAIPGYRCIDLSQLSNHDLKVVDEVLVRYRSRLRTSRRHPRWPLW